MASLSSWWLRALLPCHVCSAGKQNPYGLVSPHPPSQFPSLSSFHFLKFEPSACFLLPSTLSSFSFAGGGGGWGMGSGKKARGARKEKPGSPDISEAGLMLTAKPGYTPVRFK